MQRLVIDAAQISGKTLLLTSAQQHYLLRVLRLRGGDRFLALSGAGDLWTATLTPQGHQATLAEAQTEPGTDSATRPTPHITLAACLPKQGFDEVVRQVTELGVNRIVPVMSDRTLLRPSANKLVRWRRIAAEAAEQSERLTVPEISVPIAWSQWLTEASNSCRCLCVARRKGPSLLSVCLQLDTAPIVVAIGPEGGWTDAEIDTAIAAGYQPVTLSTGILRAVTASVTALSLLQAGFEFVTINPHEDTTHEHC